jgi:UDP-2,3-diacylglucosamine hydrolase
VSSRLLFISDLHLEESRPDITEGLLRFLERETGRCQALYILGDLFEVWLGDDTDDPLAEQIAAALNTFATSGADVYLMHGNRDFLIGSDFADRCGASLLNDPAVIASSLGPILLSHGDALCTDDTDYQRFRQQVRNPEWQRQFLAQPLAARRAFAEQARTESRSATSAKAMEIMDVNQQAVQSLLAEHEIPRLLHGHTHRPAMHDIDDSAAGSGWRLVLGDWDKQGWYAEVDEGEVRLESFPL